MGRRKIPAMQPNPWKRLANDWPDVVVVHRDMGQQPGQTEWMSRGPARIVLNSRLKQVGRRCVLAHELEHLDRGMPCDSLRAVIENRVLNATALYLLPDVEYIADMAVAYDLRRAAQELWVTWPVLVRRLKLMSDAELDYIGSRREHEA